MFDLYAKLFNQISQLSSDLGLLKCSEELFHRALLEDIKRQLNVIDDTVHSLYAREDFED